MGGKITLAISVSPGFNLVFCYSVNVIEYVGKALPNGGAFIRLRDMTSAGHEKRALDVLHNYRI